MMSDIKTITLDARSFTLLLAICSLCVAFFQRFAARRQKGPIGQSLRLCTYSFLVMASGHFLLLYEHARFNVLARALSNTLVLAGIAGYYLAVQALRQEKLHDRYCLAVVCANFLLFIWFFSVVPNLPFRLAILNVGLIMILLPLCWALITNLRPDQRAIWWTTGALFTCMLIVLTVRTVFLLTHYYHYLPISDGLLLPWLVVRGSFLVTIIAGFFFVLMAIEEVAFQNARLAALDALTSIYNRRAFEELAGMALIRSKKSGSTSTLLTLDLDHFKTINDKYGHAVGDSVLKNVTRTVASQLRSKDIFARSGGEEFTILLPDTATEEAMVVAERLRQVVQKLSVIVGDHPVRLTISIGLATNQGQSKSLERLTDESDQALYQAKSQGRNRIVMALNQGVPTREDYQMP